MHPGSNVGPRQHAKQLGGTKSSQTNRDCLTRMQRNDAKEEAREASKIYLLVE